MIKIESKRDSRKRLKNEDVDHRESSLRTELAAVSHVAARRGSKYVLWTSNEGYSVIGAERSGKHRGMT
jgi:hypothetical protein